MLLLIGNCSLYPQETVDEIHSLQSSHDSIRISWELLFKKPLFSLHPGAYQKAPRERQVK